MTSLLVAEFRQLNEKEGSNPPKQIPTPAPIGGVDVRCGPILRLCGTHESSNLPNYRATLLLVIKDQKEVEGSAEDKIPTVSYKISDLGSNGEFDGVVFHKTKGYSFIRYAISFLLQQQEQLIQYSINGERKNGFQFYVPAIDQLMNVVLFSCNGFSLGVDPSDFKSSPWFDVLKNHQEKHYHVMLGGGDQIYSDSIKKHSKKLQKWMEETSKHKKRTMEVDQEALDEFHEYYLNNYMGWFGQGFWEGPNGTTLQGCFPAAMASIPSVNIFDDHDIIDGFGSYKDKTMQLPYFSAIGNVAYEYYMLFQHQMSVDEAVHNDVKAEPQWIMPNQKGPFIKQKNHSNYVRLGKEIGLVGVDCRTERRLTEIVTKPSYDAIFARLEREISAAPEIKHLLVMLGVPIMYPRLAWLEWLLTSSLLKPARALAIKGVINKGLVNEFDGGVEVLDDLNDHWCLKHHKKERNYLLSELTNFGALKGVRITILSGDVHLGCLSRLKLKIHHAPYTHIYKGPEEVIQHNANVVQNPEQDPRLIFNVILSAIINTPPPDAMATLLNKRLHIHHFSQVTDEDVLPLFLTNPNGSHRDNHQFLNKRNWSDLIIAKQSEYKSDVGKGIKKFPGPLSEEGQKLLEKFKESEIHVKYPLEPNSLVTTFHFEDKTDDFDCNTALYEVLIPEMVGKYKIENPGIKHLISGRLN